MVLNMNILVVEDEHKIARALKTILENQNHSIDIAYSGDEGMALATLGPYDMVILDRMLPRGFDGLNILKSMRGDKVNIPVLMLTGMGDEDKVVEGLKSGADDYMVKPFSVAELTARVQALIRRNKEYDVYRPYD